MSYTDLQFKPIIRRPHYKILCLIIASKTDEYAQMEQQWRKHIAKIQTSSTSQTVAFFFLYSSTTITAPVVDHDAHTITIPGKESLIPGIFDKTMQALTETIHIHYDYLLRTNLSSFFDFRKLAAYLETQPTKNYTGTFLEISNEQIEMTVQGGLKIRIPTIFLNGAAFLMSKDVVFETVHKYTCMTPDELSYITTLPDDVAISLLVASFYDWRNMRILPRFAPVAKITLYDVPQDIFHVRLKTAHMHMGSRRLDIANMETLVDEIQY
jgi:hypothetical protein